MNEDIAGRMKQTAGTIGAIVVLALVAIVLYLTYGVDHEKQASQECWGEFEDVRDEYVLHLNNGLATNSKDEARRHYQRALGAVTRWYVSHGNIHPEFEIVVVDWKSKARSLVEYRLNKLDNWIGGNSGDDETTRLQEQEFDSAEAVPRKFLELYPV